MARATATCHCATCGKDFVVTAIKYNRREADSWESWAVNSIDECGDCRQIRLEKERAAENAAAADAAKEAGLPDLTGSERQIAWANTIRGKKLAEIDREFDVLEPDMEDLPDGDKMKERYRRDVRIRNWYAENKTAASWWIDHRDSSWRTLFREFLAAVENGEILLREVETPEETSVREAAQAETVAAPEDQLHSGVVDITVTGEAVSAFYTKDDDFRTLVKAQGYRWDADRKAWRLKITVTTGRPEERAAELGNKLLNAGFAIRIADADTLQAAISGQYEPQTYRWITHRPSGNCFYVEWGRSDDLYDRAKALPGARYAKPGVTVPLKAWREIEDFARIYDFKLSPGAVEEIEAGKAAVRIVSPAPAREPEYHEQNVADVLETSADVIEDLKDA